MPKNKSGRPEWFKFWQRNRRQLDIEQLSMESRGIIFTNMMRYFDGDTNLLPMDTVEAVAFYVVKINVDDAFDDYAGRSETNRENGAKGGRPPKAKKPNGFLETYSVKTNPKKQTEPKKPEDRIQKKEVSSEISDDDTPTKKKTTFDHDHEAYRAAAWLSSQIQQRRPERKPDRDSDLQRWADSLDKLNRIDRYDWDLISDVLTFSQRDDFWQRNILSGQTFRKQFDKLLMQMPARGRDDV